MIDLTDCENFLQIISQLENTGKINIYFIPLLSTEMPWPDKMLEFSGFSVEDISRCAFHMHEKW